MRNSIIIAVGIFFFAGFAQAVRDFPVSTPTLQSAPWFCHGNDCPHYTVVKSTDNYEEREYDASMWAVTDIDSIFKTKATVQGFKRLRDYISGQNDKHVLINMTAPVLTWVVPCQGLFCKSNFTVGFFVWPPNAWSPPIPSNPDIRIIELPKQTFYVLQYGGFAVEGFVNIKARNFAAQLKADGVAFEQGTYATASYDPPFRLTSRHNEIWIGKAGDVEDTAVLSAA